MNLTPSGNRRQMKQQTYSGDPSFASSAVDQLLEKLADTLDLGNSDVQRLSQPAPDQVTNEADDFAPVADAMNQSTTLPQEQPQQQSRDAVGGFEDKDNDVVQAVLRGLKFDPNEWVVNNTSTSEGGELTKIRIDMTKTKPEAEEIGPVVEKP